MAPGLITTSNQNQLPKLQVDSRPLIFIIVTIVLPNEQD